MNKKETLTSQSRNAVGMPLIGFGTYQMSVEQAELYVKEAIKAGFRHIDSAEGYNNEEGTGKGIQNALNEIDLKRSDLFITTKLFPGYQAWGTPDKTYEQTIENLKKQLQDLQLEYVDLYLIHGPMSELRLEQWKALMELKKMGLAKHIGVSNYAQEQIEEIKTANLDMPEVNQVEFHPICRQPNLSKFMKENNINPTAYSPLAPLSTWRNKEGQGGDVLSEIKQEAQKVIAEIAHKTGVTEAKLLLRWCLQHDYAVLTKSTNSERIKENLNLFDFEISEEDMKSLDSLNKNQAIAWAAVGLDPMKTVPVLKQGK